MKVKLLTQGGWKSSQLDTAKNWLDESDQQFYAIMEEVQPELTLEQIEEFKKVIDEELDKVDEEVKVFKEGLIKAVKKKVTSAMAASARKEMDRMAKDEKNKSDSDYANHGGYDDHRLNAMRKNGNRIVDNRMARR